MTRLSVARIPHEVPFLRGEQQKEPDRECGLMRSRRKLVMMNRCDRSTAATEKVCFDRR
jgi:hypothetical protein